MDKSVSLVSGIGDIKTTKKYYDDWSRKYDSTLNQWKYTVPKKSISLLKSKFNRRPNKILDLACGTGLFGEELIKTYKNGQKWYEGILIDGKVDGLFTFWYRNGQKSYEEK